MGTVAITLREAGIEDAPILAAAERSIAAVPGFLASHPSELTDERIATKIAELEKDDSGIYLVAENEGVIVGHALLEPMPQLACRHVVHLTIAVHPRWQGKGIGRKLLLELIRWAKANPRLLMIELNVRASNVNAQALYKSLGFMPIGRWSKRIQISPGRYVDDISMELCLRD